MGPTQHPMACLLEVGQRPMEHEEADPMPAGVACLQEEPRHHQVVQVALPGMAVSTGHLRYAEWSCSLPGTP